MFNGHSSIQYTFTEFLLCKRALLQVAEDKLLVFMKSVVFRLETSNDLVTSEENILLMCGNQDTSKTFDFYPCCLFNHWKIVPVTVFHCQLVATLSSQLSFQPRTWLLTCPVAHSQSVSTSYFSCTPLHPHRGLAAGDIAVISQTGFPCSTFVHLSSRLVVFLKLKLYYAADTV